MKPIVYQLLPRLFGNKNLTRKPNGSIEENGCGKFNDLDDKTLERIRSLGVTHVWFTGVIRHATQTDYTAFNIPRQHPQVVKGRAGSPYAIADYYDVDPDLAVDVEHRMAEFEALLQRTHANGMKVVIDFVPNHVAREYQSVCKPAEESDLGENDDSEKHFSIENNFYYLWGQPLELPDDVLNRETPPSSKNNQETSSFQEIPAKATGNDQFSNRPSGNDWYETVKLNYGVDYCDAGGRSEHFDPIPDTWHKMLHILLFWAGKGVDAFRCDMVFMVPVAFWQWAIAQVKKQYPNIKFIGEIYDPPLYRSYVEAGFDWLYDKVGMYDCLRDVVCRRRPASDISACWQSSGDLLDHMLYFLENHDEQRIASDFFASDARKAVPAAIVAALLNRCPFMIYAGQEFGERGMGEEGFSGRDGRTTIFDYWCVDTLRRGYYFPMHLNNDEKRLRSFYRQLFTMANQEKAVSEGEFFDLMYCNMQLWQFNSNQQYAFLRKADDELLLVVVNFSDKQIRCGVMIPQHAFNYLEIKELSDAEAIDLFKKETLTTNLLPDATLEVSVAAFSGRVLKFRL
ncbi:MAG: alpha-amylase [Prevotella sp.]|nr:alpha-amylase [Prevotella sp.]